MTTCTVPRQYAHFAKAPIHAPEAPDVLKFVCVAEGIIYINLDAAPDANLIDVYF